MHWKKLFIGLASFIVGTVIYVSINEHFVTNAKRFSNALIPFLETYKTEHGGYPEKLQPDWYAGKKIPRLIDLHEFYAQRTNSFSLTFKNKWELGDNIYAYHSGEEWVNFD
jgi:hypothetical protein